MKRMLPVTELARDERFSHMAIEDAVFDPRNLCTQRAAQHLGADATRTQPTTSAA